jgi:transposase
LGCSTQTVGRWRGRFAQRGIDALHDEPRPGKPRSIGDEDEGVRFSVCEAGAVGLMG